MTDAWSDAAARAPTRLAAELARIWPDHGRASPARSRCWRCWPGGRRGAGRRRRTRPRHPAHRPSRRGRLAADACGTGSGCTSWPSPPLGVLLLAAVAVRDAPWFVALCLLGRRRPRVLRAWRRPAACSAGLLAGVSLPLAAPRCLPWLRRGAAAGTAPARPAAGWPRHASRRSPAYCCWSSGPCSPAPTRRSPRWSRSPTSGCCRSAIVDPGGRRRRGRWPPPSSVTPRRAGTSSHPARRRPVRMVEWLVPIAVLDALFLASSTVQLTVLFGGHRHVLETAGLTYAEYARSGFGQLVVVTLLTLSVVAATVRWAPRHRPGRNASRCGPLLGVLCALTLVIVVSALYRLHLYEEAFGFTRLRLFMNAFESWLGVLVVLVLLAGIRLRATLAGPGGGRHRRRRPAGAGRRQPGRLRRRAQRRPLPGHRQAGRRLPAGPVGGRGARGRPAARAGPVLRPARHVRRLRRTRRTGPGEAVSSGSAAGTWAGPGRPTCSPGTRSDSALTCPHLTSGARDISCLCQTRYIVNGEPPCRSGGSRPPSPSTSRASAASRCGWSRATSTWSAGPRTPTPAPPRSRSASSTARSPSPWRTAR